MKISKDSWHYKLLNRTYTPQGTLALVWGRWLTRKLGLYYREWEVSYWTPPKDLCTYFWCVVLSLFIKIPFVLVVSLVFVIASPFLALVFLAVIVVSWIQTKVSNRRGISKPNRASLILAYVKAKKDKVCPLLEFED